jgi:hypothetical protein
MYIVIFNYNSRDSIIMTNDHGFVEEFAEQQDAVMAAYEWIDGKDYRNFRVYKEDIFKTSTYN